MSNLLTGRLRRAILPAVAGLGVIAGAVLMFAGAASATDASVTYKPECIRPSDSLWKTTVTFTNQWDGPTVVTLDANLAAFHDSHTLNGNGDTWTPSPFITSDPAISFIAKSDHPEHFHGGGPVTINRPAGCVPPSTSVPTTPPTTTCSQAIPPRDDCGGPTTTPAPPVTSVPPTTVKVCEDGGPPRIPVEDGSLVCPEFFPPTTVPPLPTTVAQSAATAPAATPTTACVPGQEVGGHKCLTLPTTGASDIAVLLGGAGALLVGGVLLIAGRRRPES